MVAGEDLYGPNLKAPAMRFRPFVTEANEALLSPVMPHDAATRLAQIADITGVDPGLIAATSNCRFAAPFQTAEHEGPRLWSHVHPEAMWHPLFWLPHYLGARFNVTRADGTDTLETDEEWLARVAVEMTASQLYNEHNGFWFDVLEAEGIDVDTENGLARVSAWQAGADDDVLDNIDLLKYLDPEDHGDRTWSLVAAAEALEVVRPVSWALSAESLLEQLDDVDDQGLDENEAIEVSRSVVLLARFALSGITDGDFDAWTGMYDQWGLLGDPRPELRRQLERIRAEHWYSVDEAERFADEIHAAMAEEGTTNTPWAPVVLEPAGDDEDTDADTEPDPDQLWVGLDDDDGGDGDDGPVGARDAHEEPDLWSGLDLDGPGKDQPRAS